VSRDRNKRHLTPYIIGASDLAFILLFFFIMVGTGAQKLETIEMPYKRAASVAQSTQSPFRIEIYEKSQTADSSRMALIFERAEPPETLYISLDDISLAQANSYETIASEFYSFIDNKQLQPDSIRIDVFSSAYSYYGLIAITIAACNELQYPCNLVYRTEAG